jgi:hypothetical protein
MSDSTRKRPLNCSAIAIYTILGVLVVLGLWAQGLTLLQWLAAIGFGAALIVIGWLLQWQFRGASTPPPPPETGPVPEEAQGQALAGRRSCDLLWWAIFAAGCVVGLFIADLLGWLK